MLRYHGDVTCNCYMTSSPLLSLKDILNVEFYYYYLSYYICNEACILETMVGSLSYPSCCAFFCLMNCSFYLSFLLGTVKEEVIFKVRWML